MGEILMIHKEDIKRVNEKDFDELRKESPKGWWSEKNATHKKTRKKDDSHRNTHHTRQGGRTDLSTSSQGQVPSHTDRVMRVLRDIGMVTWGYSGLVADSLIKEVKIIRDTIWK